MEGGLDRFTDEEVVEFLLTLGTPRKDVKQSAREALKTFGGLRRSSPRLSPNCSRSRGSGGKTPST